ncbi:MAG: type II toxin-antitoxin system RelE/ParE family toxin [Halobacteria archaeon]
MSEWSWRFTEKSMKQLRNLEKDIQEQIISKLDEVVSSEWREPVDYLDTLENSAFYKLRVGDYRISCDLYREDAVLEVQSIRYRNGAY